MVDEVLDQLIAAVLGSAKYRAIHPGLVARIGKDELAKGRKLKEAVKATKNKLHQVGGAYLGGQKPYAEWLSDLTEYQYDVETFELLLLEIMENHASTKERVPILDHFYTSIFASLPPFESVLDIACGLNPLTIPWMNLPSGTKYFACDIYGDMIGFVQEVLNLLPIDGTAQSCDGISNPPGTEVDLALVLKTIPCLEQVDKQAGERLLEQLNAKYILVSFPAKSLGGRDKGMRENYEARFNQLVEGKDWAVERFEFETELAYLIRK